MNIQSTNYNTPNFGFNIRVKYEGSMKNICETDAFFPKTKETRLKKVRGLAEKILPDDTVFINIKQTKLAPYPEFQADYIINNPDGIPSLTTCKNSYDDILATLQKATNPYSWVHSRIFYNGEKSPENIARSQKISAAFRRTV